MHNFKRTVTALGLLLCILASSLLLVACGNDYDDGFWLLTEDMTKYIELDENEYKNAVLTIDKVETPTMDDVNKLIRKQQLTAAADEHVSLKTGAIKNEDNITLWYRGEINMAEEGAPADWVDFIGGSNYNGTIYELRIGSGNFIDGFEAALIGLDISTTKYTKVSGTSKVVGTDGINVVNITYTCIYKDPDSGKSITTTMTDRVDLRKEGDAYLVNGRYDETTIREDLIGKKVGEYLDGTYTAKFDITGDLVVDDVKIKDVKVASIVTADNDFTFTLAFPDDYYQEALAGKEARWHVAVTSISRPPEDLPSIDELGYDFISNSETGLGITYESIITILSAEEAATIGDSTALKKAAVVEHYKEYLLKYLEQQAESTITQSIQTAFWKHIIDKVTVKQYPEDMLNSYIESIRYQAESEYAEYTKTYGKLSFPTLAAYLVNFYDVKYFPDADSIEAGFRKMAEEQLRQEMALYYIAQKEGLALSKSERDKVAEEQMTYYLASYNQMYASQLEEPLTEEDMVEQGLSRRYFVESTYYTNVNTYIAETLRDKVQYKNSADAE